jgi:hypothetical protein
MSEAFVAQPLDTGYTQVPHGLWTLDMSGNAKCLLGWLHSHTPAYLAKLSVNRCETEFGGGGSIRVWLRELTDAGFLSMAKDGNRWVITLLAEPWVTLHRKSRRPADPAPADPAPENPPIRRGEPADPAPVVDHREDQCEKRPTDAAERRPEAGPPVADEREIIAQSLCAEMANAVGDFTGKRPTPSKTWCQDMERMVRIDGRDPAEIRRVIQWLYSSSDDVAVFWAPNVLCPGKLRTKWATIAGQAGRKRAKPESMMDRVRARLAAEDQAKALRVVGQ